MGDSIGEISRCDLRTGNPSNDDVVHRNEALPLSEIGSCHLNGYSVDQ